MKTPVLLFIVYLLLTGCAASKSYLPSKKYSEAALKEDYTVFRNMLEEAHPSLYWFTPRDSMDYFFDRGKNLINDSLTEQKFRNILSYVVAKIRCGHTSVRASTAAQRFANNRQAPSWPIFIKAWPDTTIVTANINPKDSIVTRGVILQSIDGRSMSSIIDSLFQHLPADGYNLTHKYQALSNGSTFRAMYASIFGLKRAVPISFIDTTGVLRHDSLRIFIPPPPDSSKKDSQPPKISKKELKKARLRNSRSLRFDSTMQLAVLEVNTFAKKNKLRSFFRKSFKEIEAKGINQLVIDMRGNGGGSVVLSNLLTKYIADKPFKIADSLYATRRSSNYGTYREDQLANWLFLTLLTKKKQDGHYHFYLFENKFFKPKKRSHYDGQVYILTGGNTFSAASLFTGSVKDQANVTVVGEETGGGSYGNSAWRIPDVILPNTKVRVRLPLFRLVVDKNERPGHGIMPDVEALPSVDSIRKSKDYKMEKVKEIIRSRQQENSEGHVN